MSNSQKIILPFFIGLLYVILATWLLALGHLHEDAYILFQYSKNLASGNGIVFDAVSGRAEGATDFLWMVLLAALKLSGIKLGVAAALLNGIGLGLVCFVILRIRGQLDFVSFTAVCLVAVSGGTAAALGGFSTLMYAGLLSLFFLGLIERNYILLAVLLIAIPLFRPDGLILALGGIMSLTAISESRDRKKLLLVLFLAGCFGVLYFTWRLNYFKMPLPLPLMVKSKTDYLFEGLGSNWGGVKFYLPIFIPVAFMLLKDGLKSIEFKNLIIICFGSFLYFIALVFAHQSQNVGYRFQFPIVLALIFTFLICAKNWNNSKLLYCFFATFGILFGLKIIYGEWRYLTNNDYINAFPQILKDEGFVAENIAITEAGRFPYWFNAKQMTDLVGLNSPEVVLHGASFTLDDKNPDFIFAHHAGRFDTTSYDKSEKFVKLNANDIKIASDYSGFNPVAIAPKAALDYAKQKNYAAYFVRYGNKDTNFSHVYFLSPKLDINKFEEALVYSFEKKSSYYESEH